MMGIEERLRRALDSAARHVDVEAPKRSDVRPTARVAAVEMGRHRWPMTIAAAAVVAVAVGVIATRGTSDPQRLATLQVAPPNSTRSAPVPSESTTSLPVTSVIPSTSVLAPAPSVLGTSAPATSVLAPAPTPSTSPSSPTFLPTPPPPSTDVPPGASLPVTVVPGGPLTTRCTDTDPGMYAISVSQAKTCPDGTSVLVSGVIVADGAGNRYLCDLSASVTSATCSAEGLTVVGGGAAGADGNYDGVIYGKRLVIGFSARPGTPVGSLVPIPTIPN